MLLLAGLTACESSSGDPQPDAMFCASTEDCRARQSCLDGECIDRCASFAFERASAELDPIEAYCLATLHDCGPDHDEYWHNWTIAPDRARCVKQGEEPYDATENVCVEGFEGVLEACGLRLTLD